MAEEKTILTVDLYDKRINRENRRFHRKDPHYRNHANFRHLEPHREETHRVPPGDDHQHPRPLLRRDDRGPRPSRCVVNKFGQWLLTINGSFDGKKSDFRSTENKITVMFTPSATLLKALENIYVNADVATVGPMIESLTDSTTGEKNLHITPNAPAIIFGSTLLIKGDHPSVGVYFTKDEEGATPTKVLLIVRNTTSEIIIRSRNSPRDSTG